MKISYHSTYKCQLCFDIFIVHIPVYIGLFRPKLLDEAFRTHELSILTHNATHLFEQRGEYARHKEAKG